MAETLSFSNGSFDLSETSTPGTTKLAVEQLDNDTYRIENVDGSTIVGLGVEVSESLNLVIASDSKVTLNNATINASDQPDSLFIGSKTTGSDISLGGGDDRTRSGSGFNRSELDTGDGDDKARLLAKDGRIAAKNSSFDLGGGDDRAKFGGTVKNIDVELGTGKDTLIFGGNIDGARVDLGGADGAKDTIIIDGDAKIDGLVIKGAEVGDVLFIGSSKYEYNADENTWVSGNDVRRFD